MKPRVHSASPKGQCKDSRIPPPDLSEFDFVDSDDRPATIRVGTVNSKPLRNPEPPSDLSEPVQLRSEETLVNDETRVATDQANLAQSQGPDTSVKEKFRQCVAKSQANRCGLPPELAAGAELTKTMDGRGCSMAVYEAVFSMACKASRGYRVCPSKQAVRHTDGKT